MNVEIRKSFEKDAIRLPAMIQVQLADAIENITVALKYRNKLLVKNLPGLKMHTE
ncbi:MAG: hypothetical protein ABI760_03200 [Ferruginibacter sp.]